MGREQVVFVSLLVCWRLCLCCACLLTCLFCEIPGPSTSNRYSSCNRWVAGSTIPFGPAGRSQLLNTQVTREAHSSSSGWNIATFKYKVLGETHSRSSGWKIATFQHKSTRRPPGPSRFAMEQLPRFSGTCLGDCVSWKGSATLRFVSLQSGGSGCDRSYRRWGRFFGKGSERD